MELFFERLCDDNFFPLKVKDSKTILSYNKTLKEPLDLKGRYKYVDITCSHFGEHKFRSEGHRPNQKVYANECPFRVRVVFKPAAEKFIVMKCETRHGPLPPKVPHPILAEHYALYRRNAYVMNNDVSVTHFLLKNWQMNKQKGLRKRKNSSTYVTNVTKQLAMTVRSSAILAGSGFTFDVKASKKENLLVFIDEERTILVHYFHRSADIYVFLSCHVPNAVEKCSEQAARNLQRRVSEGVQRDREWQAARALLIEERREEERRRLIEERTREAQRIYEELKKSTSQQQQPHRAKIQNGMEEQEEQ
ncbi:hypothetical protein DAPPUDRAFT_116438 [Daphnia pulex]|uniref:Uncharacterized protein n=1 Tax=Daphnia pulex TaxID=6669 RepID=E9HPD8_DAPPU|nr:hypothetical protein DAPPUDRAFT_116438 [Daphnia pulex]|eukprot:EFX66392.1 hypothetical protein DAPPUDRAFT_116438 [Daphnia pulex]